MDTKKCPECGKGLDLETIDDHTAYVCGCGYSEEATYEPDMDLAYETMKEEQI